MITSVTITLDLADLAAVERIRLLFDGIAAGLGTNVEEPETVGPPEPEPETVGPPEPEPEPEPEPVAKKPAKKKAAKKKKVAAKKPAAPAVSEDDLKTAVKGAIESKGIEAVRETFLGFNGKSGKPCVKMSDVREKDRADLVEALAS